MSSAPSPGPSSSAVSSRPTMACASAMGVVLLVIAFVVCYFSLRYSRGALVD